MKKPINAAQQKAQNKRNQKNPKKQHPETYPAVGAEMKPELELSGAKGRENGDSYSKQNQKIWKDEIQHTKGGRNCRNTERCSFEFYDDHKSNAWWKIFNRITGEMKKPTEAE